MNRYPIVPFTNAAWPLWVQAKPYSKAKPYSEGYLDRYERKGMGPGIIEKIFTMLTRDSGIPDGYITNVGGFLRDINYVIRKREDGNSHQVQCSVLSIKSIEYNAEDHIVIVHNILIRPCVWGLGFFRLVLLQLIISCYMNKASLWILNPRDDMIHELEQISTKFHDDEDQVKDNRGNILRFMILDLQDMGRVIGKLLRGNRIVKGVNGGTLLLNARYNFPSSDDLNHGNW
jgi:hypothetical protein